MIVRLALVLLAAVAIAAIIGRWLNPRIAGRGTAPRVQSARKCQVCEAYVLGAEPEPCGRADCPFA
jgi:hypothetical protein